MAAQALLNIKTGIAALILMRIMAGCTIHFTTDEALAALQQLYLVTVHIKVIGIDGAYQFRQFKISKGIARLKAESWPQHRAFVA